MDSENTTLPSNNLGAGAFKKVPGFISTIDQQE